jgi:F-type H+-transporting ATPase subunit delta
MIKVASRYAVALFDLALEQNQLDSYQQQLAWINDVFIDSTVFKFFTSVKVNNSKKKEVLQSIIKEHVDAYLVNFLFILIDKRRMSLIRTIAKEFHSLCNVHKNIQEGIVYSIRKLAEDEINDIEKAVSEKLESKVELKNYINPRLLSGVRVVIGDTVIDGSLQAKMAQLKQQLLKENR